MANAELLQKTLDYIEAHPERWHQGDWARKFFLNAGDGPVDETCTIGGNACGTAYCFAGWAIQLARPDIKVLFNWFDEFGEDGVERAGSVELRDTAGNVLASDDIAILAAEDLEISVGEADVLFEGENTLEQLREYVRKLIAGETIYDDEDDDSGYCCYGCDGY